MQNYQTFSLFMANEYKLAKSIYESKKKINNVVVKSVLVHRHQCTLRVKRLKLRLNEFVPEFRDEKNELSFSSHLIDLLESLLCIMSSIARSFHFCVRHGGLVCSLTFGRGGSTPLLDSRLATISSNQQRTYIIYISLF